MQQPLIFVDTEYTTFGPTRATGWPEAHHHKEIVQIAAVLYDLEKNKELSAFNILIRPTINPQLSNHFTTLTHITQIAVDTEGITFHEGLKQFQTFCADYPLWTFDQDWYVFKENCTLNSLPLPFQQPFTQVKTYLSRWGIDASQYSSGTLYTAIGLLLEGHVHNALHDVRSMAATVSHFSRKGQLA